jgi:hypothetical protein
LKNWLDTKTSIWYINMDIETWPWYKNVSHDMKHGLDKETQTLY